MYITTAYAAKWILSPTRDFSLQQSDPTVHTQSSLWDFLSAGNERLDLQFQELFFSKLNILEDNGPDVLSNIRKVMGFKLKWNKNQSSKWWNDTLIISVLFCFLGKSWPNSLVRLLQTWPLFAEHIPKIRFL